MPKTMLALAVLALALAGCAPFGGSSPLTARWDTELDRFEQGDLKPLGNSLLPYVTTSDGANGPAANEARRWLLERTEDGRGSAALPSLLTKAEMATRRLREASKWLTYARIVLYVDGPSCSDGSAWQTKMEDLLLGYGSVDQAVKALPSGERMALVDDALRLEARTWPTRRSVPSRWLCSGLLERMRAAGDTIPEQSPMAKDPRYMQYARTSPNGLVQPRFESTSAWEAARTRRLPVIREGLLRRAGAV